MAPQMNIFQPVLSPSPTTKVPALVLLHDRHEDFQKEGRQPNSPPAQKTVTFDERVRAKWISRMSPYDIASKWYLDEEYAFIRKEVRFEASLTSMGGIPIDDQDTKYCSLGLDPYTKKGSRRRRVNKKESQKVVLEEQRLQREEGSEDPEYIAQLYGYFASTSVAEAQARAHHLE